MQRTAFSLFFLLATAATVSPASSTAAAGEGAGTIYFGSSPLAGVSETSGGTEVRSELHGVVSTAATPAPALGIAAPASAAKSGMEKAERERRAPFPNLTFLVYGGAAYADDDRKTTAAESSDGYLFGELNLLAVSRLSKGFSALAQVAFSGRESESSDFRIEQLEIKYSHSGTFQLRLGQLHTPLGYWNRSFHNISWLRPSIFRPEILRLEGDGGILPVRSVGVSVAGATNARRLRLGYEVGLLNGRRASPFEGVGLEDLGDAEGVNVLLTLGFSGRDSWRTLGRGASRDLELGVHGHFESIPTSDGRLGVAHLDIDETILGGFVAWTPRLINLIGEYYEVGHRDNSSGRDFNSRGWFLQWSSTFGQPGRWRLYQRLDSLQLAEQDPYFAPIDRRDVDKLTTGVRWEPTPAVALRLEIGQNELRGRVEGNDGGVSEGISRYNSIAFEIGFRLSRSWDR